MVSVETITVKVRHLGLYHLPGQTRENNKLLYSRLSVMISTWLLAHHQPHCPVSGPKEDLEGFKRTSKFICW